MRGGDVLSGAGVLGLWLVKGEMLPSLEWMFVGVWLVALSARGRVPWCVGW